MITQNVTLSNASEGKHTKWSKIVNCNLFTHRALRSSKNSLKRVRAFQIKLEFESVGF